MWPDPRRLQRISGRTRRVTEWQATIDALLALPEIGVHVPIGYSGMSLAGAVGLELFGAFASEGKVLHAYPGGHPGVPTDCRIDSWFFARHLGRADSTPVEWVPVSEPLIGNRL